MIKSRRIWAGHVASTREMRNAYKILVGRPEGKRLLERPKNKWENNIKMDFREIGFEGVDRNYLAQYTDRLGALVNTVMNLHVP
jgi:hypothetical protein